MSDARLSASEYAAWRAKLAVVFALRVACAKDRQMARQLPSTKGLL